MDRSDDNISSLWKKQQKTLPLWAQRLGRSSSPPIAQVPRHARKKDYGSPFSSPISDTGS